LFLKSLQIQGFKSFPDKVKLEFGKGIICTVGPNGSGKSNISDAVRWVLGEQAPSALRVSNMEEVVFSGTATRKAAGFAEVIMTIDNTQRWLAPDTDEVSVGRRYYRSGTSEYRINGKQVLLRDVIELLMDTGVGRSGYSMIGQGKVSEIVDARSHDRRVIFEEAAGITKYRRRKEETERNLQKTEDNLTHLSVILSGLEERVGPLEKEAEKAKQYIELQKQHQACEIGLWLLILGSSTDTLRDLDYKMTLMASQRGDIDKKIAALEEKAEQSFQQSQLLAVKKDECIRSAAAMEEQAVRIEGEAAVLDTEITRDRADIERLDGELQETRASGGKLEQIIAAKVQLIADKREEAKALDERRTQLREEIEQLHTTSSGSSDQLEVLYGQQNALTVELSERRLDMTRADTQLSEIATRSLTMDGVIEQRTAEIGELEQACEETRQAIEGAAEQISSLGNTLGGYRMRLDKQRQRAEAFKAEADSLRIRAQEQQHRAKVIEDCERSMEGYDNSVRKVMQRAESGALRGVHGPVSRVIKVDPRYATAVEIALGAAIKNIIVDNENDAKRAIEFLRQNKAGRVTFQPISVIRGQVMNENGLDQCDGYIDIASRLVECDEQYRNIINSLLGRVCIAEDIDSAIAIGRRFNHRFKIVTLDGQVVNSGGSMTGGSTDRVAGLLSRRGELEKLRAEAQTLLQKAQAATDEYNRVKQKAAADEAELVNAQSALTCAQEDKVSFEADLRITTERLERAKEELVQLTEERDGTAERVQTLEKQRTDALLACDDINRRLEQLAAQIAERVGSIDRLEAQRSELSEQLGQLGMSLLAIEKEIEALEQQLAEQRERMAEGGGRETRLQQDIAALQQHIEQLTEQSRQKREEAVAIRAKAGGSSEAIAEIEQERDRLEQEQRGCRSEVREITSQRESLSSELGKLEERIAQTRREYDNIIARLMEEYKLTRREAEEQYPRAENEDAARRQVNSLRNKMRALGNVNIGAIEEFRDVSEKYEFNKAQIEDVLRSKAEMERMIADMTKTMQEMFLDTFAKINRHFGEIFPELFGGGRACMRLVDDEDCLNCGIELDIEQPSKTKGSNLSMSGGEKSIVAVAIYFAIMKVKPSPFCFLDEIDSALDEHNVVNIANYIKRFTDTTQYIVITHRRGMMEAAGTLYGVTKSSQDGVSQLIELRLDEVEERLGKLD